MSITTGRLPVKRAGGRYNSPEIIRRYAARGARVLRTDLDGAVEIATDGVRLAVRTAARLD